MNIILTSSPNFSQKINEERKAIKLENAELIDQIKLMTKKYDNLLFICSNPDDYKKNESYAKIIEKSLSLAGIKFEKSDLLDSRNWLFTKSLINISDLIIVLGGNPLDQMEFFNSIDLKNKIKKYDGCIMTVSAGTINMANYVYCSKDDEIDETVRYRGLGLTDLNIEPHFDIEDEKRINEILLKDSEDGAFYALPEESFITIKNNEINMFGDIYYFSNGNYEKKNKEK